MSTGAGCGDHQPAAGVHADVVDHAGVPRRGGEEDQVAGQQVVDGDGLAAGCVLVAGDARQGDSRGPVGPQHQAAAVERVGPGRAPHVRVADLVEGVVESRQGSDARPAAVGVTGGRHPQPGHGRSTAGSTGERRQVGHRGGGVVEGEAPGRDRCPDRDAGRRGAARDAVGSGCPGRGGSGSATRGARTGDRSDRSRGDPGHRLRCRPDEQDQGGGRAADRGEGPEDAHAAGGRLRTPGRPVPRAVRASGRRVIVAPATGCGRAPSGRTRRGSSRRLPAGRSGATWTACSERGPSIARGRTRHWATNRPCASATAELRAGCRRAAGQRPGQVRRSLLAAKPAPRAMPTPPLMTSGSTVRVGVAVSSGVGVGVGVGVDVGVGVGVGVSTGVGVVVGMSVGVGVGAGTRR